MNYEEFKNEVVNTLKEFYGADATVVLKEVKKNNCICDGIQIHIKDSGNSICPIIYINDLFKDYEKGAWDNIDGVVDFIVNLYEKHVKEGSEKFNDLINNFDDWSYVKDHVFPMLIPRKNNEGFISELVHKNFLDFAVVYYISGTDCQDETYSIKISHQLFERYDISIDELDKQAQENNISEKYTVLSMYQTLLNIMGGEAEEFEEKYPGINETGCNLYVISSKDNRFGAAGILNKDVLLRAEKHVGNKFYILPSSIHVVIITPDYGSVTKEELNQMVVSVNATEVPTQDILSDHVYYYKDGEISIAA